MKNVVKKNKMRKTLSIIIVVMHIQITKEGSFKYSSYTVQGERVVIQTLVLDGIHEF